MFTFPRLLVSVELGTILLSLRSMAKSYNNQIFPKKNTLQQQSSLFKQEF